MKLPELKKKFNNKYVIRIIAGVLTIAMVGTGVSVYSAHSENPEQSVENVQLAAKDEADVNLADMLKDNISVSEKEIGKDETVYLISDATGNVTKTIVSDHLVNKDKATTLKDKSTLKDIENVKGDEEFTQSGDDVTWQADGSDIYYQGTSTEKTPVSMKVSYKLDGKDVTPEELAGKSGKVTIRYDYTNNSKFTETVNGEEVSVCVPFAAITGMVLDDSFTNVEVTNGKVQTSGNNNIVIGYALPGLKDSLDLKDSDLSGDVNVPEYFEVTADVENFSLETAMTVVANAGNFLSTDGSSDLSSVDDMINTLTDASSQLQNGSAELASGADKLADGASQLVDGSSKIAKGSADLASGLKTLDTTVNGNSGLVNGLKSLLSGLEASKVETQGKANALFASQEEAAKKTNDAVTAAVTDYVTDWTYYQNYARGIMDIQTTAQGIAQKLDEAVTAEQVTKLVKGKVLTQTEAASLSTMKTSIVSSLSATYIELDADANGVYSFTEEKQTAMLQNYSDAMTKINTLATLLNEKADGILSNTVDGATSAGIVAGAGNAAVIAADGEAAVNQIKEQVVNDKDIVTGKETAKQLISISAQLSTINQTLSEAAPLLQQTIVDYNNSIPSWQIKYTNMNSGIKKAITEATGYAGYVGGVTAIETIQSQLSSKGMTSATLDQLGSGVKQLTQGAITLSGGSGELKAGIDTLSEGANTLKTGSHTLADGMVEFNETGINKLVNAYTGDLKPLASRLQAVLDAGEDYQSYTDVAEGVNGSVKFVYKLGAIKAEDAE